MLHPNPAVAGSSLDLDVAVLPEPGAPGVLDQPIVLPALVAVPDHGHLVVEDPDAVRVTYRVAAAGVVKDSAAIVTEVGSLNTENGTQNEILQLDLGRGSKISPL